MRQSRFNRNYELEVNGVAVRPPMRVSFSANKAVSGGLNKLTVQVFNLKESNRLALAKDAEDNTKNMPISFKVGYGDSLGLLFRGTVHRGINTRKGPDIVTELVCLDGGFDYLNSFTSKTVRGKSKAVDAVLADMPNTGKGKITKQQELIRPRVMVGASARLLDELLDEGETWYIDNEQLHIIKNNEVVSRFIPVVNSETGLLTTPSRENSKITFETLMNPSLKIAGLCSVESKSAPHLDGVYKIDAIGYSGDNYGSDWTQSVTAILAGSYSVV